MLKRGMSNANAQEQIKLPTLTASRSGPQTAAGPSPGSAIVYVLHLNR